MKKERLPTYRELQNKCAAFTQPELACSTALDAYYLLDIAYRELALECHSYLGQLVELEAKVS